MLAFKVKRQDGGWVIKVGRQLLAGPIDDLDAALAGAIDIAREEWAKSPIGAKVILRKDGVEREVFNAGQFACDRPRFADFAALHDAAHAPEHRETCLYPIGDQPGVNLLRLVSGVELCNLTLPPLSMESTWAGDYADASFERFWHDEPRRPYLIHWAGVPMHSARPIHDLFYSYLTPVELDEWHADLNARASVRQGLRPRLRNVKNRALRAWDALSDG